MKGLTLLEVLIGSTIAAMLMVALALVFGSQAKLQGELTLHLLASPTNLIQVIKDSPRYHMVPSITPSGKSNNGNHYGWDTQDDHGKDSTDKHEH